MPKTYTVRDRESGKTITFQWDGPEPPTEADMAEVFAAAGNQPDAPAADPASALDRLWSMTKDVGIGAAKGLGGSVVGLGELVHQIPGVSGAVDRLYGQQGLSERAFAEADTALEATNTPQMVGKGLEFAAEMALPIAKGVQAMPTTAKAGAKFQRVMSAAKDVPVDMAKPGDAALRIHELAERGASMPQVVRKLLRRTTDPNQGPMTYEEARDFLSNISRLSADEAQRLTPVIKRQVAQLRSALDEAVEHAAGTVGKGQEYRSAMTEYRRASQIRSAAGKAKNVAVKGAIGTAAYQLAKSLGVLD